MAEREEVVVKVGKPVKNADGMVSWATPETRHIVGANWIQVLKVIDKAIEDAGFEKGDGVFPDLR